MRTEPLVGRHVSEVLSLKLDVKDQIHRWLPAGLTLLGGKPKSGKSTLAEQIAADISLEKSVLYLALEYNPRMAQGRFSEFTEKHRVHLVLEGELKGFGQGGERDLEAVIISMRPSILIVDILAKLKRRNIGSYDAEYHAMTEIKELVDKYDMDGLVLTHSGKSNANDSDDPFDKIIGSTAVQGVPDNLMILSTGNGETVLNTKGRLILPSKKILTFSDGRYTEKTGAGADISDRAPTKSDILNLLERYGELRVSEIAKMLQRSEPQISEACKRLASAGRITRENQTKPYRLIERS